MEDMNTALHARLAELQMQFAGTVNDKLAEIDEQIGQLLTATETSATLSGILSVEAHVHKLAGLSGTLAFDATSQAAQILERECERLRAGGKVLDKTDEDKLTDLRAALDIAVRQDQKIHASGGAPFVSSSSLEQVTGPADDIVTILVVEDDLMQAHALQIQLANLGFRVENIAGPEELERIDFSLPNAPSIVLMDIMIGKDRDAGLRVVREMRSREKLAVPVIFTTARNDIAARIDAVRGGGDGYVVKPVNITHLVETIRRLTGPSDAETDEILIVGPGPEETAGFERMLTGTGMNWRVVDDPMDVLEALDARMSEVILMNTSFADFSGEELASMIRQVSDDLARIPIVFFSNIEPDKSRLLELRAGGDDYLVLPVDPESFLLSLSSRSNRSRKVREIVKQRRASEQRFHAIFETANDAIITTDANDRIIFWNRGAEQMFGSVTNDVIGMPVLQFFPKRHYQLVAALRRGAAPDIVLALSNEAVGMCGLKSDGTEFPVEMSATEWSIKDQRYVGYIIRDITERKKAEDILEAHRRELAEKTRILQTTLDSMDQGFVVWDDEFNMVVHSQKCLDFWYQPPAEAVAQGVSMHRLLRHLASKGSFGPGDVISLADQQYERVVNAGENSSEEFVLLDNRVLDIHRFPLPGGGYVAKYTDITRQRRSEAALTKTANELKSVLTTTSQGYWLLDETGMTLEVNPRMAEILGVNPEAIQGQSIFRYLDSKQTSVQMEKLEKLMAGHSESYELVLKNDAGGDVPCMFNATPLKNEGEPGGGFFALVSDVSEYKENQKTLQDLFQEQAQSNKAKSDFLSSMSHELRTPLNAILGFGQMLELDAVELLNKDQQDSVGQIMSGGRHLLELINDILDLSKIEAGLVELQIEDLTPTDIVNESIVLVAGMARERDIEISVSDQAGSAVRVRADDRRLKQIMLNLLSNAVKYNKENGKVHVSLEPVANNRLRFSVRDTGAGIPKDKHNKLFQPFSRLGAENTGVEGTGIGLVVIKNLIAHMNGSVGVDSEVGKGSTFWVELPIVVADGAADNVLPETVAEPVPDPDQVNGKLLYVEDNPANLLLMERIVARVGGLSLITAETGEIGIEKVRSEKPDVIILDINLPGISGIETLAYLRDVEGVVDTPILAMSAAATKKDIEKGLEAGFLHYLTKPIDIAEVVDTLKNVLDS
jgi:PAS domain S-box-containing protein